MLRKLFTISFLLILTSMMFAQERAILKPNGEVLNLKSQGSLKEAIRVSGLKANGMTEQELNQALAKTLGAEDTLTYTNYPGWEEATKYRFGYDPLDVMVQWYVAPTDLNINAIGFHTNTLEADYDENSSVEMKIVKCTWDAETITGFTSAAYLGYYPADGYEPTPIAPFMDDEASTGDWVNTGSAETSPFGEDIWSDEGYGAPATPVLGGYQWVEMNLLAYEPEIAKGEVFGVVLKNVSPLGTPRLDVYTAEAIGIPGFKFYSTGRNVQYPEDGWDAGWWLRTNFTWDIVAAVTYTGDTPPAISGITSVATTLSTDAQTVEATIIDENPSGGAAGVATALLQYSVDGGATYTDVAMTASGDVYSAQIPGQAPGTTISYKIYAADVEGNETSLLGGNYFIFQQTANTLVVFNGTNTVGGYPNAYYFGRDDFEDYTTADFEHDSWAYGAASMDLFNLYDNIIEITANNSGPQYIYNDLITAWLAADGNRNYMLIGDEWLGVQSDWENMAHEAGSFHYDVLGITFEYNDVNYDGSDTDTPSLVMPVQGSALGNALYDLQAATAGTDSMLYDPSGEIEGANFLDGADVLDDVEVDLKGVGLDGTEYNIGFHRTLPAGNKVAVLLYDALSLNSSPEYYWFGFSLSAPQVVALEWFEITIGVEDEALTPDEFGLAQNYPNPFNPTTTINFSLASKSNVSLKVYNLLGQEVMTLIDGVQNAGVHEVNFDASTLSSGVYFYTITAGDFVSTKKMMLLK